MVTLLQELEAINARLNNLEKLGDDRLDTITDTINALCERLSKLEELALGGDSPEAEAWTPLDVDVTYEGLHFIATSVIKKVLDKNADYGDAWQQQGSNGWAARLADKLFRIETLADGRERLVEGESLTDTLVDAIGYSMLGLFYLQYRMRMKKQNSVFKFNSL